MIVLGCRGHLYYVEDHVVDDSPGAARFFDGLGLDAPETSTCDIQDKACADIRPILATPGFD